MDLAPDRGGAAGPRPRHRAARSFRAELQLLRRLSLEALFVSAALVALAEVGDKTQLLSLVLAARYRKPAPIIAGILVATAVNHALAALLGTWLTELLGPRTLRWIVALSFIAMGAWILVPDKLDEVKGESGLRFGVFGATVLSFFLAEMGDKTQIATVALAARFHTYVAVVAGTTLGILAANAPVVLFGGRMAGKFSVVAVHRAAAALFVLLGVLTLLY